MIVDSLEYLEKYKSINPLFEKVLSFIKENDIYTLDLGKREIDGKTLYCNCQQLASKSQDEAKLESHNKYIDIQIPLSGSETMGYSLRSLLKEEKYDEMKDITFYTEKAKSYIEIEKGMFAIFFPEDAHAPGISKNGVKKLIFKVLI